MLIFLTIINYAFPDSHFKYVQGLCRVTAPIGEGSFDAYFLAYHHSNSFPSLNALPTVSPSTR